MARKDELIEFLKSYADGKYAPCSVCFLPEDDTFLIIVPEQVKDFSTKARNMLCRRIDRELGIVARIRKQVSYSNPAIGAALGEALAKYLPDHFVDVILGDFSKDALEVVMLVNDTAVLRTKERLVIKKKTSEFLSAFDARLSEIWFCDLVDDIPSKFQLLRILFEAAPVISQNLFSILEDKKLRVPSLNWLKRELESLARDGLVLWQANSGYVLTEKGMMKIPNIVSKSSPDIRRVLALARKKW